MKINPYSQLKALLLIIVFSLNIVVGFACSIGLDMVFNRSHHETDSIASTKGHSHSHTKPHKHEAGNRDHHSKKEKDNCCKDEVAKFAKVDKQAFPKIGVVDNNSLLVITEVQRYDLRVVFTDLHRPESHIFNSYHPPPIEDIRIAIQSFQI